MQLARSSGVLLHPTSLPSRYGIGDFGEQAYQFADQLIESGQRIWQMLPLGPTGYGDSPYQLFSAFAGNPLLISPDKLAEQNFLDHADLENTPTFLPHTVEYSRVIAWKRRILEKAFNHFQHRASTEFKAAFLQFCENQAHWLDDYALFIALKEAQGMERIWTDWDRDLVLRRPAALAHWRDHLKNSIECQKYWQFEFFRQWKALREYCNTRGLLLMGDIPIYVAHDSADVWSHANQFLLEPDGKPSVVAGVPPDYFSATGQLWGNPIYHWLEMEKNSFQWWVERFRAAFEQFDLIRLDHFRGFQAYWEVPATEPTAMNGRWVTAPGAALFRTVRQELGDLQIVAENLGVITPEVETIRHEFGFPGMAILQFAFGKDPQGPSFRPHNYPRDVFAYTGTHDNDTVLGWWNSVGAGDSTRTADDIKKEKEFALRYLGTNGDEMNWVLIRALFASVAQAAIVPMQDILGLGSESRMNIPAKASGNWLWRMPPGAFIPALRKHLREYAVLYDRA